MTTHDILVAARKRIEKPENWCKGKNARAVGLPTCAGLSIVQVGRVARLLTSQIDAISEEFQNVIGIPRIVSWNDAPERTHAEVLEAFDKAIAATAP